MVRVQMRWVDNAFGPPHLGAEEAVSDQDRLHNGICRAWQKLVFNFPNRFACHIARSREVSLSPCDVTRIVCHDRLLHQSKRILTYNLSGCNIRMLEVATCLVPHTGVSESSPTECSLAQLSVSSSGILRATF